MKRFAMHHLPPESQNGGRSRVRVGLRPMFFQFTVAVTSDDSGLSVPCELTAVTEK